MPQSTRYGWYSFKQSCEYESHIYLTPDGSEITVTSIGTSPTEPPFAWGDGVCRGEVTEHVRAKPFMKAR